MKTVAFVPARGGSKSIPNKNIINIAGKPLIYYCLKAAEYASNIDEIYVATDSKKIKEVVESFDFNKVSVIDRAPETTTDTASTESVLLEFAYKYQFNNIILIQATSPLLTSKDLDDAFKEYIKNDYDSLLSVVEQKRFIWKNDTEQVFAQNYDPNNRPRRQDFESFFIENGSFYITGRRQLLQSKNRISGKIGLFKQSIKTYFELDEKEDFEIIELLLEKENTKEQKNIFKEKIKDIKVLITDVDGVLTDAGMYYNSGGDFLKKFNTRDGMGIARLKDVGIETIILTSEDTEIVKQRAKKLKIDRAFVGVKNKLQFVKDNILNSELTLKNIAYIGDDLNDLEIVKECALSASPNNATPEIKNVVDYLCQLNGGEGCVREFAEIIIESTSELYNIS